MSDFEEFLESKEMKDAVDTFKSTLSSPERLGRETEFFLAGDLPCSIYRQEWQAFAKAASKYLRDYWTGYVGVPPSHPWYGLRRGELREMLSEAFAGEISFAQHEYPAAPANLAAIRRELGVEMNRRYDPEPEEGELEDRHLALYRNLADLQEMHVRHLNRELEAAEALPDEDSSYYPHRTGLDIWWIGFTGRAYDLDSPDETFEEFRERVEELAALAASARRDPDPAET